MVLILYEASVKPRTSEQAQRIRTVSDTFDLHLQKTPTPTPIPRESGSERRICWNQGSALPLRQRFTNKQTLRHFVPLGIGGLGSTVRIVYESRGLAEDVLRKHSA